MQNIRIIFFSILWLLITVAQAETIYVIDELKIGLHENPTIDSPIMKLVPSGTELSVIERNDDLVHVQEPEGTRGWINNKYVVTNKPGKTRVNELEKEIELLKLTAANTPVADNGTDGQKQLEQQLKSERLKSGELQVKLADLKTRIASVDNSEQFLADIEQLKQENNQLISQLESSGLEVQTEASSTNSDSISLNGWKQLITTLIIILIIGMAVGAIALDHLNRRRHGGFRI
jgi:SH3 domain protein